MLVKLSYYIVVFIMAENKVELVLERAEAKFADVYTVGSEITAVAVESISITAKSVVEALKGVIKTD